MGSLCEIDVDECALNPCRNGGQCSDRHNGFECTCEKGFAGKVCEIYEDPCDGFECSLHGFCVADPFPNCICDPGFSGERCEKQLDACEATRCEAGGTCYSQNMTYPEYICLCPEGATGYRCQVQCGGEIRLSREKPAVSIASPDYPRRYSNSITCSWRVLAPAEFRIDIVDFDVEDGSDCLYDVLTIRAEALPEATSSIDVREMKLCGNSWKGESLFFNETSHQIVNLEFKTNEFFSRRGFLLALELKEETLNEMKRAAVGEELSSVSQGSSTVSATIGSTTHNGESTSHYSLKTSMPNARTMTTKQPFSKIRPSSRAFTTVPLESKLRSTQPELENLSQPTVVKNNEQLFTIPTIEKNLLMIGVSCFICAVNIGIIFARLFCKERRRSKYRSYDSV